MRLVCIRALLRVKQVLVSILLGPGPPNSVVHLDRAVIVWIVEHRDSSAVVECEAVQKHVDYVWVLLGQVCPLLGVLTDIEQPQVLCGLILVISRAPNVVPAWTFCPLSCSYTRIGSAVLCWNGQKSITNKFRRLAFLSRGDDSNIYASKCFHLKNTI